APRPRPGNHAPGAGRSPAAHAHRGRKALFGSSQRVGALSHAHHYRALPRAALPAGAAQLAGGERRFAGRHRAGAGGAAG
nr:hypothetical protein [Tanacetum cinerariifolium]